MRVRESKGKIGIGNEKEEKNGGIEDRGIWFALLEEYSPEAAKLHQ